MEARLQAEELARVEARARQVAEQQSQESQRDVVELQGKNQELVIKVQRLTHLLHQKPKVRKWLHVYVCVWKCTLSTHMYRR